MVKIFRFLNMYQVICHNVQRWRHDKCSGGGCSRLYFIRDVGLGLNLLCFGAGLVLSLGVGCGEGFLSGVGIGNNVLNCRGVIVAGASVAEAQLYIILY